MDNQEGKMLEEDNEIYEFPLIELLDERKNLKNIKNRK